MDSSAAQGLPLPTSRHTPAAPRRRAVLAAAIVVAILAAGIAVAYGAYRSARANYDLRVRPQLLREAGPIQLGPLTADLAPETVLPPATGSGNAADDYLQALDSYAARRAAFLHELKQNPNADEPQLLPAERDALYAGAAQRDCDFYAKVSGEPRLFHPAPGKKFHFIRSYDPFADRPYVATIRLIVRAAMNAAKRDEQQGHLAQALPTYQAVTRLGWHLRQNPGSMLDLELGLDLEQMGLHYLDVYYGLTHDAAMRQRVAEYTGSVDRLQAAAEAKYAQLGNVEAAATILRGDSSPMWRVEAAAALYNLVHYGKLGWFEARSARRALSQAKWDRDPTVAKSARLLAARPAPHYESIEIGEAGT